MANLSQQVLTREFLMYFVTCFIALFDFLSFFLSYSGSLLSRTWIRRKPTVCDVLIQWGGISSIKGSDRLCV